MARRDCFLRSMLRVDLKKQSRQAIEQVVPANMPRTGAVLEQAFRGDTARGAVCMCVMVVEATIVCHGVHGRVHGLSLR